MLKLTINGTTELLPETDSDDALRRYWEAKTDGDTTAELVRVEDKPPPAPDPPVSPPPTPEPITAAPNAPATAVPGQVSDLAAARVATQEAWLTEAGFSVRPPLFTPGTRVVELGDENFRLERERVEEMPSFDEAARGVVSVIREEDRQDIEVRLKDLTLTTSGSLVLDTTGDEYGMEPHAFHQLAGLGGFSAGARYLREQCNSELRSANVNWQLMHGNNRSLVLRTRLGAGGRRHVFAAVTPSYTAIDTDTVLEAVRPALADAHTELVYDGEGVQATALWMPDEVVDLAAGDIFKVGVRLDTNDIGKGRIVISGVVFRNLCLNLIIIGESQATTISQVHRGDPTVIIEALHTGVEEAREKVGNFLEAWGKARTLKLDPAKTIQKWVEGKQLKVKGERDKERLTRIFLSHWAKEPGDTLADVVNAVTRAAHEHTEWPMTVREILERQAAELVYAHV